ncbi:MAG: phosphate signaling complex protein PhoU [Planctomycetes bacterium]|nr:phosphate signaling complex protein PhoU [Planctomycetota bacterium]
MTNIRHFDMEIAELKRSLATMGDLVERTVGVAVKAILHPVVEAREQARVYEDQLDKLDSEIEDKCHQILALQAPMAKDMRLLVTSMRVAIDLESIGDLAESLAKRASWIARHTMVPIPATFTPLSQVVIGMVHGAIEAFISGNIDLARQVIADEDRADALTKQGYGELKIQIRADGERLDEHVHLLRAIAHLEQIADVAVSIAEEAVYIEKGMLIRHHHEHLDGGPT